MSQEALPGSWEQTIRLRDATGITKTGIHGQDHIEHTRKPGCDLSCRWQRSGFFDSHLYSSAAVVPKATCDKPDHMETRQIKAVLLVVVNATEKTR